MGKQGICRGNLLNLGKRCRAGDAAQHEHLVGASDRSATPADGICVGNVVVAWSQLDFGGRGLVLPQRYWYQPGVGHSALKYAQVLLNLSQSHQIQVLCTCV